MKDDEIERVLMDIRRLLGVLKPPTKQRKKSNG